MGYRLHTAWIQSLQHYIELELHVHNDATCRQYSLKSWNLLEFRSGWFRIALVRSVPNGCPETIQEETASVAAPPISGTLQPYGFKTLRTSTAELAAEIKTSVPDLHFDPDTAPAIQPISPPTTPPTTGSIAFPIKAPLRAPA